METHFLQDALLLGQTLNAFMLGTVLLQGWFWIRSDLFHTVYRGQDGYIDYDDIQAIMELEDSQITLSDQNLPPNTLWHFLRRQVSDCGLESPDSPLCIINIDSNGDMMLPAPNRPLDMIVEQLEDGKARLRWRYSNIGEEVSPTGFRIYMDSGSGFDFGTPDDSVSYGLGRGEFSWTSSSLEDGQLYRFCVRSYREAAGETVNNDTVSIIIDAIGPDAITGLTASWEEV